MAWRPEEFDELASHLRRQMGAELREEAEEVERLADLQRRRRLSLADVALRAMHRGDRVTVNLGGRAWSGTLTGVGLDYLQLETAETVVEAPLAQLLLTTERSRAGGQSHRPESRTWRARLAEIALLEVPVRILTDAGDHDGAIVLVASDHVEMTGGRFVPIEAIRGLVRSKE